MGINKKNFKRPHFELRKVRSDGSKEMKLCSLRELGEHVEGIHMDRREFLCLSTLAGAMFLIASCTPAPKSTPTPTSEGEVIEAQSLCENINAHISYVTSISFSPDGKLLASGSYDMTIKLWNVVSGELLKTLKGHTDGVISISFSPDGNLLASGSDDKTIKLWNVVSGELLKTLKGHTGWVKSISFSPDGNLLASGSYDKTIKLWDAVSFKGALTTCLFDPAATEKKEEAITYQSKDAYGTIRTYTLPCGSPVPPGAICTCNCVPGTYSVPDFSHTSPSPGRGRGGTICTCDQVCTCVPVPG